MACEQAWHIKGSLGTGTAQGDYKMSQPHPKSKDAASLLSDTSRLESLICCDKLTAQVRSKLSKMAFETLQVVNVYVCQKQAVEHVW